MVPMRSRKENSQLPESWRALTIYTGSKVGPLGVNEEIDGESWEPDGAKAEAGKVAKPTDISRRNTRDESADILMQRKKEKKERKAREQREQEEQEAREKEKNEKEKAEKKRAK